jgi:spermidine/putrescine transport system permease protein
MEDLLRRYGYGLTTAILLLTAFWLIALVVLPYLLMFVSSFKPYLPADEIGGPRDVYTISNYISFFESPIRYWVFFVTIAYSVVVTVVCLALAYPAAYYIAKVASPRSAPTLFMLLLVPMLVSEILRAFAWTLILNLKGALNALLLGIGLLQSEVHFIVGYSGVVIGLVYTYVLFMLLPIYSSIQSLDSNQIEAAEDLGAGTLRTHWRVIIPHSKPGIVSGCVMVFMLSVGSILVPTLLASSKSPWFTDTIKQVFDSNDWQTGSAFAFLLLLLCTTFVTIMMKIFRVGLADIAK